MRAVIRFLARGPAGTVEQRDKVFEGDAITLGRATDQVLHLKDRRVALKHARIFRRGERLLITSSALSGVIVNGALCRDAAVAPGDVVAIGSNTLRFFAPPAGFDLAFTFELDAGARTVEAARELPVLKLADTRLAKRSWSWALFAAVALACLIVPSLATRGPTVRDALRASVLPDDALWSSGPLSAVHQGVATQCESCHQQPFVRVGNDACLECHAATLHQHAADAMRVPGLAQERCTACHREHNEPANLVRRDPRTCAQCHANPRETPGEQHDGAPVHALSPRPRGEGEGEATDFATAHPEFRLTLLERGATTDAQQFRRVPLPEAAGTERSGLVFPHDVHLDGLGVRGPEGDVVMQCADCHRPEPGGARMQPIRMEQHCERCHRLDFEPADPERTVPHGDPKRVLQTLIEYYSARYLEEYPDPLASARPSRTAARPGVSLDSAQRARALELARTKAYSTARDLFERRVCQECHEVRALTDADGAPQWQVEAAVLTQEWMPKAQFAHSRHSTALTECTTCHAADESGKSSDVLMPGIETCRTCHGGSVRETVASDRIPSDCTLCHAFHIQTNELWAGVGRVPTGASRP